MENNVFGIMTTFCPAYSAVENAISIAKQCQRLVIVDDTGLGKGGLNINISEELQHIKNIVILANEDNSGIAVALNIGVRYAINNGADYIVTFDDDTEVCDSYVRQCLDFYMNNTCEIGAVSLARGASFIEGKGSAVSKRVLITSGMFVNSAIYENNDLIPEDYFIDLVDFYTSFKIRGLGYKIYVLDSVGMIHSVGHSESHNFLSSFKIYHHAPFRLYYQLRNSIFFARDFWKLDTVFCSYILLDIVRIPLKAMFFEANKIERLTYCVRGIYDGVLSRKGKLNE
ncbi:glycosyltransferase [Pseudomonadales bacterium]|jgi:rhamnosyltransferase|nr:glycosyltransferase [Pseudomonadales bacterium]